MTDAQAFIGLGSNLQSPRQQLEKALDTLSMSDALSHLRCSRFYQSKAIGPGEQPDYLNAVATFAYRGSARDLLKLLQGIENQQGRQRGLPWAARTLDLDLLLFADLKQESAQLTLPHPRICERNFVLFPLAELAPDLILDNGLSVAANATSVGSEGLKLFVAEQHS